MNLWAKGTLLARLLGDPLNCLIDPWLEKLPGTLQFNTTQLSPFYFLVTGTSGNPVYAHRASSFVWNIKGKEDNWKRENPRTALGKAGFPAVIFRLKTIKWEIVFQLYLTRSSRVLPSVWWARHVNCGRKGKFPSQLILLWFYRYILDHINSLFHLLLLACISACM